MQDVRDITSILGYRFLWVRYGEPQKATHVGEGRKPPDFRGKGVILNRTGPKNNIYEL